MLCSPCRKFVKGEGWSGAVNAPPQLLDQVLRDVLGGRLFLECRARIYIPPHQPQCLHPLVPPGFQPLPTAVLIAEPTLTPHPAVVFPPLGLLLERPLGSGDTPPTVVLPAGPLHRTPDCTLSLRVATQVGRALFSLGAVRRNFLHGAPSATRPHSLQHTPAYPPVQSPW